MSFLAPLFLLGALAVTLPIAFHLVRRSTREQMPFSSLMFLRPSPPRVTRRSRLEHILLLLLRCLVILLLALAFSRPFFQKTSLAEPVSQDGTRIVVLVDASASMRREALWTEALAKAGEVFQRATPADQLAVVLFDDRVRTLTGFEQWAMADIRERASAARAALAGETPSWRSTHLGNALIVAAEMLEESERQQQSSGPRKIVVISDFQEGSRLDGLQGYDWPRGIEVAVEPASARRADNAGIQWVMDVEHAGGGFEGAPRLRVSNSSDAGREQFLLQWEGIPGAGTVDVYVPPGQSRIVQAPELPPGKTGDRIRVSGDGHEFDNTVHIVRPPPRQTRVLHVGDEREDDPAQGLFYLGRVFLDAPGHTVRITAARPESLSASLLAEHRLAFIASPLAEAQAAEARRFIEEGGTAVLLMNDASFAPLAGNLAQSGIQAVEAAGADYVMISRIDTEHPLFAPFADPRFSDFTKIQFWKHRRLELGADSTARVLAWFDSGDPAIVEVPRGKGRLLVFASTWRPADSQLALSTKFVPLLYSILEQAGGGGSHAGQYKVGDPVDLSALTAGQDSALSVRKPDGVVVALASGGTRFTETDQPGIYEVAGARQPARFAVNLDAAESRTAPMPLDMLDRLAIPLKGSDSASAPAAGPERLLKNSELEMRQKLWRWLIVAAMAVLILETWVAGRLTRGPGARNEAIA